MKPMSLRTTAPAFSPATLRADDGVLTGLRASPKCLPSRLPHDPHGLALIERIHALDGYYLARTERRLLEDNLPVIAAQVGAGARVIEPGVGERIETRMLLRGLHEPAAYVPIDVASAQIDRLAASLRLEISDLEVQPLIADYAGHVELPVAQRDLRRTLVFCPGPTIGTYEPEDARELLARFAALAGPGGMLLLGSDATHDPDALEDAYQDAGGLTAALDLHILTQLNQHHGATFELDAFEHRAVWNQARCRVELHLISRRRQVVRVDGEMISFAMGESIVTAHHYKHPPAVLGALLVRAGWRVGRVFTAPEHPIRLWLCQR